VLYGNNMFMLFYQIKRNDTDVIIIPLLW